MITLEHLSIYRLYNGDGDGFVRCGTIEEKAIMNYKYWSFIDDIIQDLKLLQTGLVSNDYQQRINKRLLENCDNLDTIEELKKFATQM